MKLQAEGSFKIIHVTINYSHLLDPIIWKAFSWLRNAFSATDPSLTVPIKGETRDPSFCSYQNKIKLSAHPRAQWKCLMKN